MRCLAATRARHCQTITMHTNIRINLPGLKCTFSERQSVRAMRLATITRRKSEVGRSTALAVIAVVGLTLVNRSYRPKSGQSVEVSKAVVQRGQIGERWA